MTTATSMFSVSLVVPAIGDAFKKLDPRQLVKNPVLFVTAAVGRPPVTQSELLKLDPETLEITARVTPAQDGTGFCAELAVPLRGVAPGQTAVLYDGTRVIGQFTIDRTVSAAPLPV